MVHKWRFCSMTHSHTSFTVMVRFGRHFIVQCMVTVWNLYFSALVLIIFVRSFHLLTVKGSAVLDELLFLHRNVSDWRIPDVTYVVLMHAITDWVFSGWVGVTTFISTSLTSHFQVVMHEEGRAPRLPRLSPSDSVKLCSFVPLQWCT